MSDESDDRTASLMTPAKLAQLKVRPQAAPSPAAWLDQLASDAGSGHARRLVDLRRQLEAQVRERDYRGVQSALQALDAALAPLDFDLLQPKGWLARATGKGKEQAAGFIAQYERIVRAGDDYKDEVRALQKRQQAQASVTERTLVEFEVEVKAIEKIIDQGARWLQDMRNQLKAREAQPADAAAQQQIDDDTRRCELLVERLKQLRGTSSAAQEAGERARTAATRRLRLLETLQQAQDGEWKLWLDALGGIADQAAATGTGGDGLAAGRARHEDLRRAVTHAAADCAQLQAQEEALAGELAAVHAALQAAA
jgi:hypothetical protein